MPLWVLDLPLSGSELRVYVALAAHAGPDGSAWPRQAELARIARVTVRRVQSALAKFRDLGLVESERSGTRGGPLVYQMSGFITRPNETTTRPSRRVSGSEYPTASSGVTRPDGRVLDDRTVGKHRNSAVELTIEQPSREAPPDLPANGSAAPDDDQPVSTPERDARRTPPLPAGAATRQTPTLWVTPRDWRPAPEFNPEVARRGLAAARAALQAARPVPPNSSEAEE